MFLYDIVNDKDIKLTDADVSNEWITSKHDWSDTNPEVLLYATCAQKPAAHYPNHRFRRRRQKFGPAKRVAAQKVLRTSDNANISATSFAFTTATTCRLFRRSRRGFCSSFLLRKVPRHDDAIASRLCCLRPNQTEPHRQSSTRSSMVLYFSFCRRSRSAGSGGSEIQTIAIHRLRTGRGDSGHHESGRTRY